MILKRTFYQFTIIWSSSDQRHLHCRAGDTVADELVNGAIVLYDAGPPDPAPFAARWLPAAFWPNVHI